jgi:hypothetical protein
MTDNQIDMADCSNRAAERDSVSDAKMKRAELTFIFQFDPAVCHEPPEKTLRLANGPLAYHGIARAAALAAVMPAAYGHRPRYSR